MAAGDGIAGGTWPSKGRWGRLLVSGEGAATAPMKREREGDAAVDGIGEIRLG